MRRRSPGFTLIETLIALAIFAATAVALSSVVLANIRSNRIARDMSQATLLAQEKLEEIRGTFTSPSGGSDTTEHFTRTWTVAAGPVANTRQVSVTVGWRDRSMPQQQIELRTLVSD